MSSPLLMYDIIVNNIAFHEVSECSHSDNEPIASEEDPDPSGQHSLRCLGNRHNGCIASR